MLHAGVICRDARSVKERDLFANDGLAAAASHQPRPAGAGLVGEIGIQIGGSGVCLGVLGCAPRVSPSHARRRDGMKLRTIGYEAATQATVARTHAR